VLIKTITDSDNICNGLDAPIQHNIMTVLKLCGGPGQRLATGWMVRGSNSGMGDVFLTSPDRPRGPPSLLHNGYWVSFLGVKWPGHGI